MAKPGKKSSSISSPVSSSSAESAGSENKVVLREEWQIHSGPLPDPRTLEYYNRVHPQASSEIFEMAKREQKNRHKESFRNWFGQISGQVFAFLITIVAIGCGTTLIMNDKPVSGFIFFIVAVGALVGATIYDRHLARQLMANAKPLTTRDQEQTPSGSRSQQD
jgi:uncharacterized membrane protein